MACRKPVLYLDVSRLFARYACKSSPTGIDRVELKWAQWALGQSEFAVRPVIQGPLCIVGLRQPALERIVRGVVGIWTGACAAPRFGAARFAASCAGLFYLARPIQPTRRPSVYVNVGHYGLDNAWAYGAFGGKIVMMIHDILPLSHPQYETAGAPSQHAARMQGVRAHADHVLCVSGATVSALRGWFGADCPPTTVTYNGPCLPSPTVAGAPRKRAPFVFLSTLDPRKNAGLLLRIWETFQAEPDPPHLVVIGREGADRQVVRALAANRLRGVTWAGAMSDPEAAAILAGARALLAPSFAEGFNVPIAEAHALGVPVVASDLPVHREVGRDGALYFDVDDVAGWRRAILTLDRDGRRRDALAARIAPPPSWDDHFRNALPVLKALTAPAHSHSIVPGGLEVTS